MPILKNISQLATCPANNPQGDAGLLEDSVLVWRGDHIEWVGRAADLPTRFHGEAVTDCGGRLVVPGLVDCHTHLCFGGWRGDEFAQRLAGASYQDIAAAGGGIMRTVTATRAASSGDLERTAMGHLAHMLRLGVTTVECKSGYGLNYDTELKQLHVYRTLAERQPVSLVATYLGGHVLPREFRQDREGYLRLVCESVLPTVTRNGLAEFCDVFIEEGAFTANEARVILSRAQELGLGLKVHADQLSDGGGARLAAEMGAVSAEHLEYVGPDGVRALAEAGVVAVSLPLASLYLKERYIPARSLIEAGVRVAVATDFNPGSAPSYHLPLAMTLACLNQNMTPAEALMGATAYAARAIGRGERIGSLQAGYLADIAIIDAPDVNHWLYHFRDNACTGVIKSGKWVHTRTPVRNLSSD
ncbi:imidazolonepropionase [Elongatibacter sediminis]|uniref:Imidazolonepropionase n=1 Tax=Elongatibacter sediminis TaxID=3119006 RepID=A0AAW9R6A7_9GAMM